MRRPYILAAVFAATLTSCSSGGDRGHPLGIISSGPPGDTSFSHLRCLPTTEAGPGMQCTRHD